VASNPSSEMLLKGLAGEILIPTFEDPIFSEIALATSIANLIRPTTEPPHWSVRKFALVERNCVIR